MNRNILTILWLFIFTPIAVFAISSTNYGIEPLNTGNSGGTNSNSADFQLDQQQIGDFVISNSASTSYNLQHGYLYSDDSSVLLNFTVIPEKRVPQIGNNGTRVIIYIYNTGGTIPIKSYSYYDTNNNGNYTGLQLTGIMSGTYDIAIKGYAHLRKRLNNVILTSGTNTVDFTFAGSDKLLCGDVYVNGSYPDGDNTVNSLDVTYLVSRWAVTDAGVSDERADVDENSQVNSLDMTKTVNNYAIIGD